ncbi:DASH complex subunit Dad1-domain-containing protein [Mycena vitilis]|nr:DASH complex subunit Dad1-domain-containing protein [Mycena vitilis]
MTLPHPDEDPSFFERERERLTRDPSSNFEDMLLSTNALNRKLEEVLGMTKEYATIAELWKSFYNLMRESGKEAQGEEAADVSASSQLVKSAH